MGIQKTVTKNISAIVITAFLLAIFSCTNVSADAWFSKGHGSGAGGSSTYGTWNTGSGCPNDGTGFTLQCTGLSWIFYQYIGGPNHKNEEFYFPDNDTDSPTLAPISKKCANYGSTTGFWHYGRNAGYNPRSGSTGMYDRWSNGDTYASKFYGDSLTSVGYFGHYLTIDWNTEIGKIGVSPFPRPDQMAFSTSRVARRPSGLVSMP